MVSDALVFVSGAILTDTAERESRFHRPINNPSLSVRMFSQPM